MTDSEEPATGEQSGATSREYVLGSTQEAGLSPIMDRFRRALNAMMAEFRSDPPSEDFLSSRILELSESSPSIDQFFRESAAFLDRHLDERRRQAETLRASLRTIQAFFTSFDPTSVGIHQQPSGSAQGLSSLSVSRVVPGNTVNTSSSPISSESSPHVLGSPFVLAEPSRQTTNAALPDTSPHTLRETREDMSMDVLQYFEGPLFSTSLFTPAPNEGNSSGNASSTGDSSGDRSHPFVLRQVIRRHHLIRTPDGRVNIPRSITPSPRSNTPSTVRARFRSAELTPYQTPRRSARRLALAKSKGKGKSVDRGGRDGEMDD